MIIVMRSQASGQERDLLTALLCQVTGEQRSITSTKMHEREVIVLDDSQIDAQAHKAISQQSAVERLVQVHTPYKLVSRAFKPERTTILVPCGENIVGAGLAPALVNHSPAPSVVPAQTTHDQAVIIGGSPATPVVMAGPCAVESREQLLTTAQAVKAAGARILRGGAFKPRTSPYQFQGLGVEGLHLLAEARQLTGLPVITEVMAPDMVEMVAEYADILQIGSRNMQNFPLLLAAGRNSFARPVMLKRGLSATIDEWLLAAEYIMGAGNPNVILCERGIRSFDTQTRNLLDLSCIPLLRELTHLPVIVDPSHGTGRSELVPTMSRAGIAAGADGLILEVHPDPNNALCDGKQSITPQQLRTIVHETRLMNQVLGVQAFLANDPNTLQNVV